MIIRTFLLVFFSLVLFVNNSFSKNSIDKSKIGPVLRAPVIYKNNLYFLNTGGALFKSNLELTHTKILFNAEKSSVSGVSLFKNSLYFGEGVHTDKKANLYAFNLEKSKIDFVKELPGHIESSPLVIKDFIFVGVGDSGLIALNQKLEIVWESQKSNPNQLFHIDTTPVIYKNLVCASSVYTFKGIACFNIKTGKLEYKQELNRNAKSQIINIGKYLIGVATEGDMFKSQWSVESLLYVIDLEKKKIANSKLLSGFNFFKPVILNEKEIMLSLSTGDILSYGIESGVVGYIGEFKEPLVSRIINSKNKYCAVGLMGKYICYKKNGSNFVKYKQNRIMKMIVGETTSINGKAYLPSRKGYELIKL